MSNSLYVTLSVDDIWIMRWGLEKAYADIHITNITDIIAKTPHGTMHNDAAWNCATYTQTISRFKHIRGDTG
jgi:hypothetical protein